MADPISVLNSSAQHNARSEAGSVEVEATIASLTHRLDALLMVLKTCTGQQCTHPWESLFPDGEVESLADALHERYNEFFASKVDRVRFDKCEKGYIAESEGPMWSGKHVYAMNEEMAFE